MTAACADEPLSREQKMVKNPSTSSELPDQSELSPVKKSNVQVEKKEILVSKDDLNSQETFQWEENNDTCNDEIESSMESLEIPSSGYNSPGNESKIKFKEDLDTQSASSSSDSRDLSLSKTPENSDSFNLHELESCFDELEDNHENQIFKKNKKERKIIYDPEDSEKFHKAVRNGNVEVVADLVKNGLIEDLNEPDWNVSGDPPLLVAATNLSSPVLSFLLSNGCNPSARSPRGETALHRAILNGGPEKSLEFVQELLKYGCSAGVKEAGGGSTALHILIRQLAYTSTRARLANFRKAIETLSLLAKAGAVNDKDHQGRSAMHILAITSVNSYNSSDNNRLKELESLIQTLLDAGADPTLKNDRGETPLHASLEFGTLDTANILIPRTPAGLTSRYGESPLHIVAKKNHVEMVEKLLKHGENPSVQDAEGNTPLHLASARGFHQVVSLLLTSPSVDLEKSNDNGLTALQVAAESGFANTVRILINAGADPSRIDNSSSTIQHRHPDIFTLIDDEITRRRQLAT